MNEIKLSICSRSARSTFPTSKGHSLPGPGQRWSGANPPPEACGGDEGSTTPAALLQGPPSPALSCLLVQESHWFPNSENSLPFPFILHQMGMPSLKDKRDRVRISVTCFVIMLYLVIILSSAVRTPWTQLALIQVLILHIFLHYLKQSCTVIQSGLIPCEFTLLSPEVLQQEGPPECVVLAILEI